MQLFNTVKKFYTHSLQHNTQHILLFFSSYHSSKNPASSAMHNWAAAHCDAATDAAPGAGEYHHHPAGRPRSAPAAAPSAAGVASAAAGARSCRRRGGG